ncbi:N-acetylmuramoyl-L-alanine amidase [Acuticoccus sp. I52.16.1]|uniref:N-acetylmuramoyl-L-alanine amidase n=1 Tax=Acuticoccus sp. I52.16.1 TaxID=2928472 RepID=UPI001FD37BB2|nr:N-acetylmuramoyl-L-alanine amidase [Acuticoccus sp. I52.16.1]UOM34395.1 N-acetylmuramoyl-L-alanine amidase [Acuticoccus sp. I52.16.1]
MRTATAQRRLGDGRPVRWVPSPNHNERKGVAAPDMIVIHYTDMTSAEAAVRLLCDPDAKVSAHYLIGADGAVVQMVEEDRRAWHAGVSAWFGARDLNSRSIGIELDNPGHRPHAPTFPDVQVEALLALLADLRARWAVPPWNVVAHSDIAPTRKIDPGEAFPWHRLACAGHVLAAEPAAGDQPTGDIVPPLVEVLAACGYVLESGDDPAPVINAFHRRHLPERVGRDASGTTLAAARALADALAAARAVWTRRDDAQAVDKPLRVTAGAPASCVKSG